MSGRKISNWSRHEIGNELFSLRSRNVSVWSWNVQQNCVHLMQERNIPKQHWGEQLQPVFGGDIPDWIGDGERRELHSMLARHIPE